MKTEAVLSRITIYPIKSLDGIDLEKAIVAEGGCLLHDREFAIMDEAGNFIAGKSTPLVHSLRSTLNFINDTVSFRAEHESNWNLFHIENERSAIQSYLSDYFGFPAFFHQNKTGRFLDEPDISGVTILSSKSLQAVSSWYDGMNLQETRKRFRANIEIEGVPAFWEDHLFSINENGVEFKVGNVTMIGMSPRARCVVPTRNPTTGSVTHGFAKSFAKRRAETLPDWSTLKEHGHYYYLTVNCSIPATEVGKLIKVGDEIRISV